MKKMIVHRPTMKLLQVTELLVTTCSVKLNKLLLSTSVLLKQLKKLLLIMLMMYQLNKLSLVSLNKMMKQQLMSSRVTMKLFKTAILMKNFLQS